MENDNDKIISEYRKQNFKKWSVIALYLLVIVLEVLALFGIIDMLWGCGVFIIAYLLKKFF